MTRAVAVVIGVGAALAAACRPSPAAEVERLEVRLVLHSDGSVDAHERLRARIGGDSFALDRPLNRLDAITDVAAFLNGSAIPEGGQAGQARIELGGGLDVRWRVPGAGMYDFEVRYRAVGAVAVRGGHAALSWRVLPENRGLTIATAVVRLELPPGTQVSDEPFVEDGQGWAVTREVDGVVHARANDASPDRAATLVVPFFVDPRAIDEPIWQRDEGRARDLLPAFVSGALFILVCAIGALVMIRVQYPRQPAPALDPARVSVARGLRIAGVATALLGLATMPLTEWTLGQYGRWPQAIPLSVVAAGIALVLYGARKQI